MPQRVSKSNKEGKRLAKEHWKWFKPWVEKMRFPKSMKEFVDAVGHGYQDGIIHGFKHGVESVEK
jgi:hypothetical protein